jgi:predicted regulator of Ras-like GTPase activity (Roadblock/LC7/MglB family)
MPAPQIQQPVSEKPQGTINATTAANRSIDRLSSANALAKPPIVEPLHIQGRNLAPLNQKTDAMSNGVVSSPAAPEAVSQSSTASEPQPPTAELKAPALQATETVQVAADSHVEQVLHNPTGANFSLDEAQIAQFIRVKHPLPSGLPVLSIAAQALRIVAIDTHNAVFLSQDGGKHWKAIQAPWSGRAVLASRIESPNLNRQTYNQIQARASGAMLAGAASPELKKQDQPSAAATCCRLAGTVTDATGAAIAGASVSVTNSASQAAQTIKTDSVGHYLIDGLAPGTYKLDAQAAGFMKQEIAAVSVADSRPNIADLSLNIASAAQTVTVEANSNEVLLDKKKNPKPKPSPIFEIVTDNGDHWTSTDGLTWKHM